MADKMKTGSEKLTNAYIRHKLDHNGRRLGTVIKWIVFSIVSGVVVGLVGTAFYFAMDGYKAGASLAGVRSSFWWYGNCRLV